MRALERLLAAHFGEVAVEVETSPGQRMGCSLALLALFAWGGLQLLYAHVHDLLLASLLAALIAVATLVLARACTWCAPVRALGELLQDRLIFSARRNWARAPMRCAVEVCVSLGTALFALGAAEVGPLAALQLGVLSGVLTVLGCEALHLLPRRDARTSAAALSIPGLLATAGLVIAGFAYPVDCFGAADPTRTVHGGVGAAVARPGAELATSSRPLDVHWLSPSRIGHAPERAALLPPAYTAALRSELLHAHRLPAPRLAFPLLRVRSTGATATMADLVPSLELMHAALERATPLLALFDLRDVSKPGARPQLTTPPIGLVVHLARWASTHARTWDTHAQAIAIVLSQNGAAKPLLQLAIRLTQPPQPLLICHEEDEALAFLAKHREVRVRTK